jgi:hypothetical protein
MRYALVLIILGISGCAQAPTPEARAREALQAVVRDPASLKVDNISADEKSGIICGEFNSRNAFGAFVGNQAFVFDGIQTRLEGDGEFDAANSKCPTGSPASESRQRAILARAMRKTNAAIDEFVRKGEEAARQ